MNGVRKETSTVVWRYLIGLMPHLSTYVIGNHPLNCPPCARKSTNEKQFNKKLSDKVKFRSRGKCLHSEIYRLTAINSALEKSLPNICLKLLQGLSFACLVNWCDG